MQQKKLFEDDQHHNPAKFTSASVATQMNIVAGQASALTDYLVT